MNPAFSPEDLLTLGKAFDQVVEKYGPFDDAEKEEVAEKLLRLYRDGVREIDRLVETAMPPSASESYKLT